MTVRATCYRTVAAAAAISWRLRRRPRMAPAVLAAANDGPHPRLLVATAPDRQLRGGDQASRRPPCLAPRPAIPAARAKVTR